VRQSRWAALGVLCAGMLMIVLDATVVNVALPAIQTDLGFSQSSLAWVVNAYLIAFGGLLLLAGRIGDLTSRRGVFQVGLAVFTAASVVCGVAQSSTMLIAARFAQGVGGALTSAVILGMIVTMFPEPRERAKAIGVYTFVASAGGSIGLLAGGVLTQAVNWHWIFLINVPIGIATAVGAQRLLPRDRADVAERGVDVPGAVLITGSLMLGVYTIVASSRLMAVVAVALLVAFVVRQAKAASPLMPLRIFRSRNVVGANAVMALAVAGMFGMFFLGVLYLQRILGYDALQTGLAFLPTTIVMGTLSLRYSERLITRFGARAMLLPGLALVAAGLAWFARVPAEGTYAIDVLPSAILLGTGIGVAFPALAALAMSGATPSDAGLASGLVNTTSQVGAAVGLAVLATVSATRTGSLVADGVPAVAALTGGYRLAFVVSVALVLAAVVVAVTVVRPDSNAPTPTPDEEPEPVLAHA
jgi:EmrB/QacA subfamily drug resistance transporter